MTGRLAILALSAFDSAILAQVARLGLRDASVVFPGCDAPPLDVQLDKTGGGACFGPGPGGTRVFTDTLADFAAFPKANAALKTGAFALETGTAQGGDPALRP